MSGATIEDFTTYRVFGVPGVTVDEDGDGVTTANVHRGTIVLRGDRADLLGLALRLAAALRGDSGPRTSRLTVTVTAVHDGDPEALADLLGVEVVEALRQRGALDVDVTTSAEPMGGAS